MIKMKVNKDTLSICDECGAAWRGTREMYDIGIFGCRYTMCYKCSDVLFKKLLRAHCMYDGKVKSKEDKERAAREERMVRAEEG